MFQIRRILVPTDFSPHAGFAFSVARDLARQNRAELLLLHVAPPPGPEQVSYGEMNTLPEPDTYYRSLLAQMRERYPSAGKEVTVQYLICEGQPVAEIERVARERACDLLVVGTHGHGALSRLLMGSTAEKLMRSARCPVLTVNLSNAAGTGAPGPNEIEQEVLSR